MAALLQGDHYKVCFMNWVLDLDIFHIYHIDIFLFLYKVNF